MPIYMAILIQLLCKAVLFAIACNSPINCKGPRSPFSTPNLHPRCGQNPRKFVRIRTGISGAERLPGMRRLKQNVEMPPDFESQMSVKPGANGQNQVFCRLPKSFDGNPASQGIDMILVAEAKGDWNAPIISSFGHRILEPMAPRTLSISPQI